MNYHVISFIAIARRVSSGRVICDEQTTIRELLSDSFDSLDFELTQCCFEGTHCVEIKDFDDDTNWISQSRFSSNDL